MFFYATHDYLIWKHFILVWKYLNSDKFIRGNISQQLNLQKCV